MSPGQLVGFAVDVAIYLGLIVFVLYRQMSSQPLKGRRLVLLPAVLAVFGLQQLVREPLAMGWGGLGLLVVGLVIGSVVGLWRGRTFRLWRDAGQVMVRGTTATLLTWGVLILTRLPFAFLGYVAHQPQGFLVGELLLALAATFAAQNGAIWARIGVLDVDRTVVSDSVQKR